jgi:hypothetical protein
MPQNVSVSNQTTNQNTSEKGAFKAVLRDCGIILLYGFVGAVVGAIGLNLANLATLKLLARPPLTMNLNDVKQVAMGGAILGGAIGIAFGVEKLIELKSSRRG